MPTEALPNDVDREPHPRGSLAALRPVISPLELDGYLTGIVVTAQPAPILPSTWMMRLWSEDPPIFDDEAQIKALLGALIKRYNAISTEIDRSVNRLEVDGTVTYRPLFVAGTRNRRTTASRA
jgi:hypothetical protein